jgi:lipid II:glycine glycyltransferase (peptidoglycan interpeptide bridge formation enzyme)
MAGFSAEQLNTGWDEKVAELGGGILQSHAWSELQTRFGRETYRAQGNRWLWQAQVRQSRGIKYLYAPYGPVATDRNALQAALASLVATGAELHADFVRFEPVAPIDPAVLQQSNAQAMPEVQPQRTLVLDLTKPADELRRTISQSNRNLINGAVRRGIRIEAVAQPHSRHIDLFLAMMRDTVARDKFHPYPDSYYADTISVLAAERAATLYFAYAGDQPVAGAIAFDFEGTRYYAHAAAFQVLNREHKAAVPLLWQMILDAQGSGAHTFDFWGIAPNDDPNHPRAGFTRFKRSFGGETKDYAGTWDLPIRPVKYRLYRAAKRALKLAA